MSKYKFNHYNEKYNYEDILKQANELGLKVLIVNDNDPLMQHAIEQIHYAFRNSCDSTKQNYFCNAIRFFITKEILDSGMDDEVLYLDFDAISYNLKGTLEYFKYKNNNRYDFGFSTLERWDWYSIWDERLKKIFNGRTILGTQLYTYYFKGKNNLILNEFVNFYKNYPIEEVFNNAVVTDELIVSYILFKHFSDDEINNMPNVGVYNPYAYGGKRTVVLLHDFDSLESVFIKSQLQTKETWFYVENRKLYKHLEDNGNNVLYCPKLYSIKVIKDMVNSGKMGNIDFVYEVSNKKIINFENNLKKTHEYDYSDN